MSLVEIITKLIEHESSIEAKLDLLTDISIGCTNDEIFKAAESVRNELNCGEKVEKSRADLVFSAKAIGIFEADQGNEVTNTIHEA